jgi:CysZ protein
VELASLSNTARFLQGIRYALRGIRVVAGQPALWSLIVAPVIILLGVFFGSSFFAWQLIGWLLDLVWTPGPQSGWFTSGAWVLFGLVVRLMFVGTIGLFLYFTAGLIATPFNDRLSESVETMVLGPYEEPFSWRVLLGDLLNSAGHTALSLLIWVAVMGIAFLLNLLPGIGSVFSFALGTAATALFIGREAMDGSMSRRRMSYGHKYRIVIQHFPMVFGFGLVVSLLLWIPFLNFVLLPMAVAGGTLMYCHLEQQGLVPDSHGRPGYLPTRARVMALADDGAQVDELEPVREPQFVQRG